MAEGYIKVKITRITDGDGNTNYAKISRIESDMPSLQTLETNIIWNALSKQGSVNLWMKMDIGVLNRDILGDSSVFTLDSDMLNVDKLM